MTFPGFLLKCIRVLLNVVVTTQLCVEGILLLLLYRGEPTRRFIEGAVLLIYNIGGPSIMGLVFIKIVLIFMIAFMFYSIFLIQRKYYILKTQTDIEVSSCSLSMVVVFINFMGALMNDFSTSI
ncbi:hypothetical protein J5N97_001300 [Dioscorea zingiberensis]|uniref:Uncharacterized protein n=1 Tax=Dioscorea zingiberensis TaxID=325984 RepID=A0A9D5H2I8_9LILI|nr:hypothetical protein J5N97_001300 [Dioscorea zingiberensis]